MQYTEREHAKHVFKTIFYSSYLTQGRQEFIPNFSFTCRQFGMAQISKDCFCVA